MNLPLSDSYRTGKGWWKALWGGSVAGRRDGTFAESWAWDKSRGWDRSAAGTRKGLFWGSWPGQMWGQMFSWYKRNQHRKQQGDRR